MIFRLVKFLMQSKNQIYLTWNLMGDPRVPLWKKTIPFLPLLYILSPFNFVTNIIPLLGQVDDFLLVIAAMEAFERTVDERIVAEYKRKRERD